MTREASPPNALWLAALILVIVPTLEELMFVLGLPKFGWFSAFSASAPNRKFKRSRILKLLNRPKSKFASPGDVRLPLEAVPKRPTSAGLEQTGVELGQPGIAKAPGLNQRWCVGFERCESPIWSGRPPKWRVLEGSNPEKLGVRNSPVWKLRTPLVSQPPMT